ncbi:MAG: aldolase/citrate lyase family protein [Pseudomonadota bacterium]
MSLFQAIGSGQPLVGTFIKTPHPAVVEALGGSGLDFIILDAEHAPFGRAEIDRGLLAARAAALPALVRLESDSPAQILSVLDMGAAGFLVPHVTSPEQAAALVQAAHYGAGGRGYSATNRAGDYGRRSMAQHLEASRQPVVIPQIEDPEAVERVEEIAAVPGITALFVGPADLAVAYGVADLKAAKVVEAVDRVIAVAGARGLPVATFAAEMQAAKGLFARGISLVAVASEQKPMQDFFSTAAVAAAKP